MDIIKMGRKWEINTVDDYEQAMRTLAGNDLCAEMSDDYSAWEREKAEVARQRADVISQAKNKGLI